MEMLPKKLLKLITGLFFLALSSPVTASDFNLPFINASDLGTAYAGWAAGAFDASTAYANPAGLTSINHDQMVFVGLGLLGDTEFTGRTINTILPFPPFSPEVGTARSQLKAFFPSFYFSAPINRNVTVGFSENAPFGLGTDYEKRSILRYIATKSQIVVKDVSPCVGVRITDDLSVGAGFDIQHLMFTLDHMFGPPLTTPDSESKNHLQGWGYGWHAGLLYRFLPCARVGFSYNSKVWFHARGVSELFRPSIPTYRNDEARSEAALPQRAQLGLYVDLNPCWAVMGTVFYTHWGVFDKITLKNVVLPPFGQIDTINIPLEYKHTFDYSLGINYKPTSRVVLRAGIQFMDAPSDAKFRSPADPIGEATVIGLGVHYCQNYHLSYDVGYGHSFFKREPVNLESPLVTVIGHTKAQSNLFGLQVNWNIT